MHTGAHQTMAKINKNSVFGNQELLEEYIKIYMLYFFLNYEWFEITEYLKISRGKVKCAIAWVSKNFLKIPAQELLHGAIFSVKQRIKNNTRLYDIERKRDSVSIRSVVELNREIREDTKYLNQLQSVYQENYSDVDISLNAAGILKIITKNKEKLNKETNEKTNKETNSSKETNKDVNKDTN